jgi:hypothetical protein
MHRLKPRQMPRLTRAPNLAVATLWADLLGQAGVSASVQRAFAGSIAGQIPPDQALPEVWIADDEDPQRAQALLDALRAPQSRRWHCRGCGELVEGPFEQCWNCGAAMPA